MFHAHIISFVTCFICILLHLFTFSWTNLLTRCPVPVSCFLLFFVSENLHRKYSRNCTRQKPTVIYCRHVYGDRRRDRGGAWSPPHHMAAWVPARREVVWGPQGSPGVRPSPIKTLPLKTLSTRSLFHEKFRHHRRHQP